MYIRRKVFSLIENAGENPLVQKEFGRKQKEKARLLRETKNAEMQANKAAKKAEKIQKMADKVKGGQALTAAEKDMINNGGYKTAVKDVASGKIAAAETAQVQKHAQSAVRNAGNAGHTVSRMAKGTRKSLASGGTLNLTGGEFQATVNKAGKRSGGLSVTLKDVVNSKNISNPRKTVAEIAGDKVTKAGKSANNTVVVKTVLNKADVNKVNKAAEQYKVSPRTAVVTPAATTTTVTNMAKNKATQVSAPEVAGNKVGVINTTKKTPKIGKNVITKFIKKNPKAAIAISAGTLGLGAAGAYTLHRQNRKEKEESK